MVRSLDSPQYSDIYTQHSCQVNVAKYSPSRSVFNNADVPAAKQTRVYIRVGVQGRCCRLGRVLTLFALGQIISFLLFRFYIASADKSGKVRIWDTVNQEHILKNEFQPISGPIKDLAWSR